MGRTATVVEGDTAKAITATLSDADGVQNLVAATVVLRLKDASTGRELEADCTLSDAENGEVEIPGALREDWLSGRYTPEVIVDYADGSRDIFPCEESDVLQDKYAVIVRPRRT